MSKLKEKFSHIKLALHALSASALEGLVQEFEKLLPKKADTRGSLFNEYYEMDIEGDEENNAPGIKAKFLSNKKFFGPLEDSFIGWGNYLYSLGLSYTLGNALLGGAPGGLGMLGVRITDQYLNHTIPSGEDAARNDLSSLVFYSSLGLRATSNFANTYCPEYSSSLNIGGLAVSLILSQYNYDFFNKDLKVLGRLQALELIFDPKGILTVKEAKELYKGLKNDLNKLAILSDNRLGFKEIYKSFTEIELETPKRINKDLKELWNNDLLYNLLYNMGLDMLNLYISWKYFQELQAVASNNFLTTILPSITSKQYDSLALPFKEFGKFMGLYFGKNILEEAITFIRGIEKERIAKKTKEKIFEFIKTPEDLQKILKLESSDDILRELPNSISLLVSFGIDSATSTLTETTKGLVAFEFLLKQFPELLYLRNISYLLSQKISSETLTTKLNELNSKSLVLEEEKSALLRTFTSKALNIFLANVEGIVKERFDEQSKELGNVKLKLQFYDILGNLLNTLRDTTLQAINVGYYLLSIGSGNVSLGQVSELENWVMQTSAIQRPSGVITLQSTKFSAEKRVSILMEALSKDTNTASAERSYNDDNKIRFKNYKLKLKDQKIIELNLELDTGYSYVIIAASGQGKTSTMKNTVGFIQSPLASEGEISLPKINGREPKILFLDQGKEAETLFSDLKLPLISIILGKSINNIDNIKEKIDKIIQIAKEIGLKEEKLTGILEEVGENLSGGEKKKIYVLRAIMQEPDILISDELFANLDNSSIQQIQTVIKKYLPHTTIITIDHYAEHNNSSGFYDFSLDFNIPNPQPIKTKKVITSSTSSMNFTPEVKYLIKILEGLKLNDSIESDETKIALNNMSFTIKELLEHKGIAIEQIPEILGEDS